MINKEQYETPIIEIKEYKSVDDILTASNGGLEYGNTDTNIP